MYRVLVVDDEEPVLDSYVFMLKGCAGFTLAGKARSGFEALKLIHELEPDLVFMDINIPGLDGLEVIADVHKKFPAMIFVLSTAYERFDLAQRAIPLGVFDYLVKPVSKKTFLATLDTAQEALQSREAVPAEMETPLQRFMRRTIWKAMGEDEWAAIRAELALPSDRGIVCILESAEAEPVCARLAELISYKRHCVYDAMLDRGVFLISGELSRGDLEEMLDLALGELPPGGEKFLGLGDLRRGPELYLSCAAALRSLEDRRKQKGSQNHGVQDDERRLFIQLRRKIGAADPAELRKLFALIWGGVFAGQDFNLAKGKMASLFMFLLDDITGCYSKPDETPLFNAAVEIMALKDLSAWEYWSAAAFEKLLSEAALRRSGGPLPLVKAIAYIREYYADPALQLSTAAEAAQVSPAYLSRLFSDQLGTSFVDYLTAFRIEKSEKLIRESGLSIKEIAFAVGYRDPNYFSKIFRKLRDLSPSEFAERVERMG
jgi:two-component system response regulator YesN